MGVLDDLTSDKPEVRLKALQGLDLNQNCPYAILSHVFELLEDDTFVEKNFFDTGLSESLDSPEDLPASSPATKTDEFQGVYVCDAAKALLLSLRILPDFFLDLIQETMEDINSQGSSWLMNVFFKFPWTRPDKAFMDLVPLFFSSKSPNVYYLFQSSSFHFTDILLENIFYDDYGGYYVFQALVRSRADEVRGFFKKQKNREACVELLVYVNDHLKSEVLWVYLDSLFALDLDKTHYMRMLKQAFERDVNFAALYLALYDSGYIKALYKVLQYLTRLGNEIEAFLMPLARFLLNHPLEQKEYPVELLFSCFPSTFWLENLEKISTDYLQEQLLKNLIEREKGRSCRFKILYQMHLRNLIRGKAEWINELWINLEAEMAGLTPPSEKNHPLAVMANKNMMPNGYNSFIFKQLKRGTLVPSFALSFWTPEDTAPQTLAFLLASIEREIIRTKEQWEFEKKERKAHPQKYFLKDRENPDSVLMGLNEKWSALLAYLETNHHSRVLQMAQNVLTIPWREELCALTEHFSHSSL